MKVVLLFPPDRSFPSSPFASLPALAPCLTEAGHEVVLRDINLEVFQHLADERRLLPIYDQACQRMETLGNQSSLSSEEMGEYVDLVNRLAIPRESLEKATRAREVMLDPKDFYSPELFNRAFDDLRTAQRFYFGPNPMPSPESPEIVSNLFHMLNGPLEDPISQAYREKLIESIASEKPDLIGISIPFMTAYFESMKLLKFLRDRLPNVPIVVGGALVGDHKNILVTDPRLYDLFDYCCYGDGDITLPRLATALDNQEDLQSVPNLYHRNAKGEVEFTFSQSVDDLNSLPSPDFSGLPMEDYLIPEAGASFQTSRGCYYGKCTFCSELFRENFRLRKPKLIVEDMIRIHETTGITHFYLWDSLCPPKTLKYVAQQVKERNLGFTWFAETKMEKAYLNPEFMPALYEGGCRFLQFGFESASQRVLNLIDKDNDLPEVEQILKSMHLAGIGACMTWFIGFPTETEGEAQLTYDYIEHLGSQVGLSAYSGTYNLLPDQPLFHEQEKYGIKIFRNDGGGYEYLYEDGTAPFNNSEYHETYNVRTDTQILTHGGYLHYAARDLKSLEELTGTRRVGPIARHIEDLQSTVVQRSDFTLMQTFPRDITRDPTLPPQPFKMVYHKISGEAFRLRGREVAALEFSDKPISAEALQEKLGIEWEEMQEILVRLSNRGLLRFVAQKVSIQIDESVAEYAGSEYMLATS